jgi:uncharacterized repeat protein (TIGR01451 family)
MVRKAIFTGLTVGALVAFGGASASAAVTIGSDMAPPAVADDCGSPGQSCTVLVVVLSNHSFAVPSLPGSPGRGVIVRWRVKEASGALRLRVIRPGPAGRTVVASSAVAVSPGPGVQTFPTRIPVATGDQIGVDVLGGTLGDRVYAPTPVYALPPIPPSVVAQEQDWTPTLVDGAVVPPPTEVFDQLESVYNADVEPDADGDGFGDETQDLCAADPTRQTACVADLAVRGSASATSVRFGSTIRYALTVQNLGAGPAEAVVLTATPSVRTLFRGSACASPADAAIPLPAIGFLGCRRSATRLTASLGTLRPGTRATVTLAVAATAQRTMATRVRVTTRATDAQAANNATAFSTAVRVRRGTCVNRLVGTASADVLRGTSRGDRLSGGRGRDTIQGRGGADCLKGGPGRDTISGGTGNDVIDARDGAVDRVSCGPGRDTVRADRRDRLRGCERRRR